MKASARRGGPIAGLALVAGMAAAGPALALDAPRLSASVPSLTAADAATFSWSRVDAPPGATVAYQGGMGDELTTFGAERSATRPLREGAQTFRVRAVELRRRPDGRGEVAASAWEYLSVVSDQSPPRITASGAPGRWASGPVTIRFSCSDAISGIASCTPPVQLSAEGAGQSVTGEARDGVGHRTTARVDGIDIDRTPPATPRLASIGRTSSVRPTLSWSSGDALSGIAGYRVSLDGREVAAPAGDVSSYTPRADLAPGRHTWTVQAIDRAGNVARADPAAFDVDPSVPPTPTLRGPSGIITDRAPAFSWSGLPDARFSWELAGPAGPHARGALTGATSFHARDLPDGAYTFRVTQTNGVGTTGGAATLGFTLDATPPAGPVITLGPEGAVPTGTRPTFRWRPAEPHGTFLWRITDAAGAPVQGPNRTEQSEVRAEPLAPGLYTFRVSQIDGAGNAGPSSAGITFVVTAPGSSTAAAPQRGAAVATGPQRAPSGSVTGGPRVPARPPSLNAKLLRPRAGRSTAALRPRLAWRGTPRGATMCNVQIFVLRGRTLVKVHTAFPSGSTYRVPPGVLRPGQLYVWRVWPYLGRRGFAPRAVGVSWFRTTGGRSR